MENSVSLSCTSKGNTKEEAQFRTNFLSRKMEKTYFISSEIRNLLYKRNEDNF